MTNAIVRARDHELVVGSILTDFGKFLRLHTADGDASPLTLHSYHANAAQFVEWCGGRGIDPATASEDDLLAYRRALVAEYKPGSVSSARREDSGTLWVE